MLLCDLVGLGEVFAWTPVVCHPLLFIGRVNVEDAVCQVAQSMCAGVVGSSLVCGVGMARRVLGGGFGVTTTTGFKGCELIEISLRGLPANLRK